jgi:hypothetical protein
MTDDPPAVQVFMLGIPGMSAHGGTLPAIAVRTIPQHHEIACGGRLSERRNAGFFGYPGPILLFRAAAKQIYLCSRWTGCSALSSSFGFLQEIHHVVQLASAGI